jgi:anti-sigma B factor antagonist
LNITEYFENNVSFIYLDGRFDGNTSWKVEQHIRDRIGQSISKFVLNMEGVPFIASSGLRVVLAMTKELRQKHRCQRRSSDRFKSV